MDCRFIGQKGGRWLPILLAAVLPVAFANDAGKPSLILVGSDWIVDAPTKIAQRLDYFNSPPLPDGAPSIRVEYANSGKQALARVRRGEADFALAASTPVARAVLDAYRHGRQNQADIQVLATVGVSNRGHHVLARNGHRVKSPADLSGARVGMLKGTSAQFAWSRFVDYHNLQDSGIELVNIPVERQLQAFREGEFDVVVTWDPWSIEIRQALAGEVVQFTMRPLYSVNWLLVTRRQTLERYPEAVQRVVRAYRRAINLIESRPARARALHSEVGGVAEAELELLEKGVVWRLGLDWSVIANMEARLRWLAPNLSRYPLPGFYLADEPLRQVEPGHMMLPSFLTDAEGVQP